MKPPFPFAKLLLLLSVNTCTYTHNHTLRDEKKELLCLIAPNIGRCQPWLLCVAAGASVESSLKISTLRMRVQSERLEPPSQSVNYPLLFFFPQSEQKKQSSCSKRKKERKHEIYTTHTYIRTYTHIHIANNSVFFSSQFFFCVLLYFSFTLHITQIITPCSE
jgi:hypothetical protein